MWQKVEVSPLDEKGHYSKDYPFRLFDLTIPGRGLQPLNCCSISSGKDQIVAVGISENSGKIAHGWHVCHERACPDCFTHVVYTDDLHALSYLLICQKLHPGSSIYSGRFHFADSSSVTLDDINKARRALKVWLKKIQGIYDFILVLHSFRIKEQIKTKIINWYISEYGKVPNGTTIYKLASDIDFLHSIGFTDFKIWQQATEPFFHFHIFVVADHYPREAYIHGNKKISISKILRGGFNPIAIDSNSEKSALIQRNSDILAPSSQALEGQNLVRYVHYTLSHNIVSNTKGLSFRAFTSAGIDVKNIHLDFNSNNPDGLNPDSTVSEAFDLMKTVFPYIKWKGKFVYPSREAPTFNEDSHSENKPLSLPSDFVTARVFYIPTEFKDGKRIPMTGAEEAFKRQDLYVAHLKSLELMGLLPILPIKVSDSYRAAFEALNNRRLDPDLKAKDRVLYTTDFPGFEDLEKANLTVDLGHIPKSLAYKPAIDIDYIEIDTMLADTARHKKKPPKKHVHLNTKPKKDKKHSKAQEFWDNYYREKRLQEARDSDFDSVEKLSWIAELEDSYYEEEDY